MIPDVFVDPVGTYAWTSGTWLPDALQHDDDRAAAWRRYRRAARAFDLIRGHDALAADLIAAAALRRDLDGGRLYLHTFTALRTLRGDLTAHRWPLPPLPDELGHLELELDAWPATDPTTPDTED